MTVFFLSWPRFWSVPFFVWLSIYLLVCLRTILLTINENEMSACMSLTAKNKKMIKKQKKSSATIWSRFNCSELNGGQNEAFLEDALLVCRHRDATIGIAIKCDKNGSTKKEEKIHAVNIGILKGTINGSRNGNSDISTVYEQSKQSTHAKCTAGKNELKFLVPTNKQVPEEQRITNKNILFLIHLQLLVQCLPK